MKIRGKTQKAIKQLHKLKEQGSLMRLAADEWPSKFQTLVAIIMSARTRDEVTIEVAKKLFARYPTASSLAHASRQNVEKIIRPVNFFRNKARSVSACAKKLVGEFGGTPPHDIDSLISFPGVGRKTANVFLAQYGVDAIGVDTHVAYTARSLRWTLQRNPERIEQDLEKLFPKHLWREVNTICVRFGKSHTSRKLKDTLLESIRSL